MFVYDDDNDGLEYMFDVVDQDKFVVVCQDNSRAIVENF